VDDFIAGLLLTCIATVRQLLDYRLLNPPIHSVLLKGLLKLSKKLKRYPRCFALRHLELAGNPVAAGTFGDIWKTQFHKETVCVKVMRVYEKSDIEALLKVSVVCRHTEPLGTHYERRDSTTKPSFGDSSPIPMYFHFSVFIFRKRQDLDYAWYLRGWKMGIFLAT
jgi:hypothetical protein